MAGLFTTPAEVQAAEAAQQRQQFMQGNAVQAAAAGLGGQIAKGAVKLFGGDPRSEAEKTAVENQKIMKGIDYTSFESVMATADKFKESNPAAAAKLAEFAITKLNTSTTEIKWEKHAETGRWTPRTRVTDKLGNSDESLGGGFFDMATHLKRTATPGTRAKHTSVGNIDTPTHGKLPVRSDGVNLYVMVPDGKGGMVEDYNLPHTSGVIFSSREEMQGQGRRTSNYGTVLQNKLAKLKWKNSFGVSVSLNDEQAKEIAANLAVTADGFWQGSANKSLFGNKIENYLDTLIDTQVKNNEKYKGGWVFGVNIDEDAEAGGVGGEATRPTNVSAEEWDSYTPEQQQQLHEKFN